MIQCMSYDHPVGGTRGGREMDEDSLSVQGCNTYAVNGGVGMDVEKSDQTGLGGTSADGLGVEDGREPPFPVARVPTERKDRDQLPFLCQSSL